MKKNFDMAEIIGKTGKQSAARIDMTPMVDLAFLLLTFFVLAATLAKPRAQEIIYPDDAISDPTPLNSKNALTLLLGEDDEHIAYYHGMWNNSDTLVHYTSLTREGIRPVLFMRNSEYLNRMALFDGRTQSGQITQSEFEQLKREVISHQTKFMVIVKTLPETPFRLVIDAMDELNMTDVKRRVIQEMTEEEANALRQKSTG